GYEPCPERTTENPVASSVPSGRGSIAEIPATSWLANFLSRFGTNNDFCKAARGFLIPALSMRPETKGVKTHISQIGIHTQKTCDGIDHIPKRIVEHRHVPQREKQNPLPGV